jgi:hypothetical protein
MRIYRVLGAEISPEHGHVDGLKVRKWREKKKSYGKRKVFGVEKVIEKIDAGDVFRTKARDRRGSVTVVYGQCRAQGCRQRTLATMSEDRVIVPFDDLICSWGGSPQRRSPDPAAEHQRRHRWTAVARA